MFAKLLQLFQKPALSSFWNLFTTIVTLIFIVLPIRHSLFFKIILKAVWNYISGHCLTQCQLNSQQEAFDFLEARLGFFFGEAREFAAERDEIVVARNL
jgi:hypothetical protein